MVFSGRRRRFWPPRGAGAAPTLARTSADRLVSTCATYGLPGCAFAPLCSLLRREVHAGIARRKHAMRLHVEPDELSTTLLPPIHRCVASDRHVIAVPQPPKRAAGFWRESDDADHHDSPFGIDHRHAS